MPKNEVIDKIVERQPVPGNDSLVRVVFEQMPPLDVSLTDWVGQNLKLGMEVTEQSYSNLTLCAQRTHARQLALRFLRVKARTTAEVKRYLIRRGISEAAVGYALETLTASGLLQDGEYASQFLESRGQRLSRKDVAWRLRQKGIPKSDIDVHLQTTEAVSNERTAVRIQAEKYMRRVRGEEPANQARKLAAYLARRGFPNSLVIQVVREIISVSLDDDGANQTDGLS